MNKRSSAMVCLCRSTAMFMDDTEVESLFHDEQADLSAHVSTDSASLQIICHGQPMPLQNIETLQVRRPKKHPISSHGHQLRHLVFSQSAKATSVLGRGEPYIHPLRCSTRH